LAQSRAVHVGAAISVDEAVVQPTANLTLPLGESAGLHGLPHLLRQPGASAGYVGLNPTPRGREQRDDRRSAGFALGDNPEDTVFRNRRRTGAPHEQISCAIFRLPRTFTLPAHAGVRRPTELARIGCFGRGFGVAHGDTGHRPTLMSVG
jgi:hypothetical protein